MKMCVGMCWPCHVLPPPRRACCTGAAPDPQSTAGLKACNREGKVNGMAGKGVGCCVTLPFRDIVPKSLTRYQHDAFPGVSLCSSVFLPHLSLGSLPREGLSWACWHVGGYLIRGSPLSCRPGSSFSGCMPCLPTMCSWCTETFHLGWHLCRDLRAS